MDRLLVFIFITGILAQAAGVFLTIEPKKVQYIGKHDVTILCGLGETDIETVGWVQISKETLLMRKKPLLSLRVIDGTLPEWSSWVDDVEMDGKSSVRYSTEPVEETYLEVTLHEIKCDDGGIYSCEVFGKDKNGSLVKEHIRDELIIYSFGQQPSITYFNQKVPGERLIVEPGSEVNLMCNGMVGKPHVPIVWYEYNSRVGAFTQLEEGVDQETLMVEKRNACAYNGTSFLTFTATEEETEVTFRCGIGPLHDTLAVVTAYKARKSFNQIFGLENGTIETNETSNSEKQEGMVLTINPSKVQYQGHFDVTIRCSIGSLAENLTQFGYIQLLREGPVSYKRPYLTLKSTNGTEPEWGAGIDRKKLEMKSTVTYQRYPMDEIFLQVILHEMECDDEGIYTCALLGVYNGNDINVQTVREELSIYTYAGEPQITIAGDRYPTKEFHTAPGTNLTLTCSGPVGKPHAPIEWYRYNMMAGAYMYTTTGTTSETLDLPVDHLCRFTGQSTLTFLTTAFETDVTFECKIGAFADSITVIVDGGSNGPILKRQKQKHTEPEINVAQHGEGSHSMCFGLLILVSLFTRGFFS